MREYVEGDIYDIASRVKDIDPALHLILDYGEGAYKLFRQKGERYFYVMTIQPGDLDARILTALLKNDLQRRRLEDYILDMERAEEAREKAIERAQSNELAGLGDYYYNKMVGITTHSLGSWQKGD